MVPNPRATPTRNEDSKLSESRWNFTASGIRLGDEIANNKRMYLVHLIREKSIVSGAVKFTQIIWMVIAK